MIIVLVDFRRVPIFVVGHQGLLQRSQSQDSVRRSQTHSLVHLQHRSCQHRYGHFSVREPFKEYNNSLLGAGHQSVTQVIIAFLTRILIVLNAKSLVKDFKRHFLSNYVQS